MVSKLLGRAGGLQTLRRFRMLLSLALLVVLVVPAIAPTRAIAADQTTVGLSSNDKQGAYLVGPNGMTLYIFTHDKPGETSCYDKCADSWPPLLVDDATKLTAPTGVDGKLDAIKRTDGKMQVTYNGQALYYWIKDKAVGDTTGDAVGKVWWLARPQTLTLGKDDKLGQYLVGTNGMTLYQFTKDKPGESTCIDKCADSWPPMLVGSAAEIPAASWGVPDALATTKRTDGKFQVTYNGWPLYYWGKDKKPGDVTGQNVGKVWFVLNPTTLWASKNDKLGDFLVGANKMTLYMFKKDTPGQSTCTDKCADNWPAVLVGSEEKPSAATGITGKLGTTKRADGTMQVTYNDMPLYYFAKDAAPGDTTGQEVGDVWYVVKP